MSDATIAIVAAFGASILTTIGTRWIAGFQARKAAAQDEVRRTNERQRDRREDERRLRDARVARIRADTVVLGVAADTFEGVGKQLGVLWAGDTKEARADRLNPILAKALEPLGPALIRLQLETGTEGIVDSYKAVWKAFIAFKVGIEMMEGQPRYVPQGIGESLKTLEAGVSPIVGVAKARIAELETPL